MSELVLTAVVELRAGGWCLVRDVVMVGSGCPATVGGQARAGELAGHWAGDCRQSGICVSSDNTSSNTSSSRLSPPPPTPPWSVSVSTFED